MTTKPSFSVKHAVVNIAISRGIFFEINLSQGMGDSRSQHLHEISSTSDQAQRAIFLALALKLINTTRGRNIVISSGASNGIEIRRPYDLANLFAHFCFPLMLQCNLAGLGIRCSQEDNVHQL